MLGVGWLLVKPEVSQPGQPRFEPCLLLTSSIALSKLVHLQFIFKKK